MSTYLMRATPAIESGAVTVTAVPSGLVGLDLSSLPRANTHYAPRFGYFGARGAAGTVAIAADAEMYVMRGNLWIASGVWRGGKAISVTQTVGAEDFVQGMGDAERLYLHVPAAGGQLILYYGSYEDMGVR